MKPPPASRPPTSTRPSPVIKSLYLRAGPGVFAANLILGRLRNDVQVVYARARTWLRNDMLDSQKVPLPPATSPEQSVATLLMQQARSNEIHNESFDRAAPLALAVDSPASVRGSVGPVRSKATSVPLLTSGSLHRVAEAETGLAD
jgi:hypothetical protein